MQIARTDTPTQRAPHSFAQLAVPIEPALRARAMALTKTPADAADLVQDTFERGLRKFHQFRPGTNIRLWLFRIMHNLFVDTYRRSPRETESLDGLDLAAPRHDPAPWETVDDQQLAEGLTRLQAPFRSVLEMHFLAERSYKEIGTTLGIPMGTVGTRILRARNKLKDVLVQPSA